MTTGNVTLTPGAPTVLPIPEDVKKRANTLLVAGAAATVFTIIALWGNSLLLFFLSVPASVAGLILLMYGWGTRHGALWALDRLPAGMRSRPDVIAFFHGDEPCPGCGAQHPEKVAFCSGCGHALDPPKTSYWQDLTFAFRRLVTKQPIEPPRTVAFTKRAPHESTDKLLVVAIAIIVGGWIASNEFSSLFRVLITVSAIVPAVLLLFWLRKRDMYEPEPWKLVLIAFGWGMLTGVFVMPLNSIIAGAQIAGVTEELAKSAIVVFIAAHATFRKELNGPVDGLIFGAAAGLGFGAMENFSYVIKIWSMGVTVLEAAAFRSVLTLSHMMWTGIAGSYLGLMMLRRGRITPRDWLVAFVPPGLLHAMNNTSGMPQVVPFTIAAWWFFKVLSDALRDEVAWGYHAGKAPVEADSVSEQVPPPA